MPGLDTGKAPANNVILPFYATGAIAFVALTVLLFLNAFPLLGGYFAPHILAIVHTAALGWGTMVIFGACYQLLPVVCEHDLYNEKIAGFSYYLLCLGAILLILSFWNFTTGFWMIAGGVLVFLAAFCFAYNVFGTIGKLLTYNIQKLFLATASVWLLLTISIGLLLAINLYHPFILNRSHLEILKLHAHAGLAGWFLELIVGISVKLVPMFLLGKKQKDKLLRYAYAFQNGGLVLFLLDGYFFGPGWRYLIYAGLVIIGIAFWLYFLWDVKKNRIPKPVGHPMYHAFVAFLSLIIALALIPVIYFSAQSQWAIIYGFFLFVGWISSLILGMTFKTLPFIIWNKKYKMLNGKVKIPLPKDLYWTKVLKWQFWLFVASLYIIGLSLAFKTIVPLRFGLGLLVLTALFYFMNTVKILTHKVKVLT